MKTEARVLEVTDERARLGCDAVAGTCAACRGGCTLRRLAPGGTARLEVPRLDACGLPLVPGMRVTVEVADRDLAGAALRAALPPLAGVLGVPLLMRSLGGGAGGGDAVEAVSALFGLLAGWTGARLWLRRAPPRVAVRADDSTPRDDGQGPPA
jgi:positive regulator of sigma E activity